jgi:hypothetical protein
MCMGSISMCSNTLYMFNIMGPSTRVPSIFFLVGTLNLQNSPKLKKTGQMINKEKYQFLQHQKSERLHSPIIAGQSKFLFEHCNVNLY